MLFEFRLIARLFLEPVGIENPHILNPKPDSSFPIEPL